MPLFKKRNTTYSERPNHAARAAHARGDQMFRTYDTSAIHPKHRKPPIVACIVAALVIVAGLCFAGYTIYTTFFTSSVELLAEGEEAAVVVEEGDGAKAIAQNLLAAGLISRASEFTDRVDELGVSGDLKPGTYTFAGGIALDDIIDALVAGPEVEGLTIPEGSTLATIASLVEEFTDGRITAEEFTQAASDASVYADSYDFLADAGTNSLEGFLFPKTYAIDEDDTAESVILMMLSQFQTEIADLDWSYPEGEGLSVYEAVTLASIVEKESSDDEEVRATVASVFYNRLGNMGDPNYGYLQSDATTAYEIGDDPTSEDIATDGDYNTYTNQGLPPTPICSPSLASLQAVCEPAETSYYFFYFAQDDDGEMQYYFSETYEQHQENYS